MFTLKGPLKTMECINLKRFKPFKNKSLFNFLENYKKFDNVTEKIKEIF